MRICEKCDNQKLVNGMLITFNCIHLMRKDMRTLYINSRSNYLSHNEKIKVKQIIKAYSLDIIDPYTNKDHEFY